MFWNKVADYIKEIHFHGPMAAPPKGCLLWISVLSWRFWLGRCGLTQNHSTVVLSSRIWFHCYASLIFHLDSEIGFPCKFPGYLSFALFFKFYNLVTLFHLPLIALVCMFKFKTQMNNNNKNYSLIPTIKFYFKYLCTNMSVVIVFGWFFPPVLFLN